ncbi:gas vesicle protein GvpG [Pimelobacter simplex]|uniref:Putative gas vesicle synthesis protein n=2 Tax=Nocardioides simplex TaxID=2045 RepID=A0A0A1DLH0_NOCSI|nr:gas vesicle protein GvpG [Pimelobacter simplex]AIY17462.1 putative gas vesicle synthesis protein [Pimelobacter simplex]GEB13969.1 gas vesicle protein [Pimelobacter simplex]SFM65753.1 Gas vesicle protein G [Pimelobacter simplex]
MGLISGLLTLPLAPLRGTLGVADQILRHAEERFYDPALIRQELEEVERRRQDGRIDEATAAAWEEELIDRLLTGQARDGHG